MNINKMFNALLSTLDLFNNINANNCMNKKNNDKNFGRIDFSCKSNQIIPTSKYFPRSNCIFTIFGNHINYHYYHYYCSNFPTKNHAVYDLLIYIHNKISLYTIISRNKTNDNYKINKRSCLSFHLRVFCVIAPLSGVCNSVYRRRFLLFAGYFGIE